MLLQAWVCLVQNPDDVLGYSGIDQRSLVPGTDRICGAPRLRSDRSHITTYASGFHISTSSQNSSTSLRMKRS